MVSLRPGLAALCLFSLASFLIEGRAGERPARQTDTKPSDAIDRWLSKQAGMKTWSAEFLQTRTLKTLTQPINTPGRVWFSSPNRFRWELGTPAQTIAVRQPDQIFVIYPLLHRAERYPLNKASGGTWRQMLTLLEAGFPTSRETLEESFRILSQREKDGSIEIDLEPRSAPVRRMMPHFMVSISAHDHELRSTRMTFADGSALQNSFTNAVANPALDEGLFQPVLAPETKITEPLSRSEP